jgi:hypothetical protein
VRFVGENLALWRVFLPVSRFPPMLHTSSYLDIRLIKTKKRAKVENLPNSSVLSEMGKNWTESKFQYLRV